MLWMVEGQVALLRGINLGKRRVTNARLKELFELAGCTGVSTFQAAGNVLFEDGPDVAIVRTTLEEGLGYLRAAGRELYWLAHDGVVKTTLDWRPVEKHLADLGTNRNITTVRRLAARLTGERRPRFGLDVWQRGRC